MIDIPLCLCVYSPHSSLRTPSQADWSPFSVRWGKDQRPRQCSFHHVGSQCSFCKLSQALGLKDTQLQDLACVNTLTPVAGLGCKTPRNTTAALNYRISIWTCHRYIHSTRAAQRNYNVSVSIYHQKRNSVKRNKWKFASSLTGPFCSTALFKPIVLPF